jgi:hypothetical protein
MNCFYFTQYESSNMITKTMEEFKGINITFLFWLVLEPVIL